MKYLRKIFESSRDDQLADIELIFSSYLDKKILVDGEEYPLATIDSSEDKPYISINIYMYLSNAVMNDIKDFDKIYKERLEHLETMKNLKNTLSRIKHVGYTWSMLFDNEGFNIKVFYNDLEIELSDCFGGEEYLNGVDESIIKSYMRKHYNLDYDSYTYYPSTSGYYGKNAKIILYFNQPVTENLISDLAKLKRKSKIWGPAGERYSYETAFGSIQIISGGRGISMEIIY
jgi:hypothetical protein